MIWHIFKKDLRLLWGVATAVAAVDYLNAGLLIFGGPFARESSAELAMISNGVLPAISLLGLIAIAIAVVQQDRLPGTTQDWLTRPIPRNRLIAAKILFVALMGLGPIFIADVLMGLAEHLRVTDVVAASLTRSLVLGGVICLPAMLVGSITRSLAGAVMFVLVVVVVLIVELLVIAQTSALPRLWMTGYVWTILAALIAANVAAAAVLLPLQFRWRATNRVRWMLGAYLCVLPSTAFLPWGVAVEIQQAMGGTGADPRLALSIDTAKPVTFSSPEQRLPPGVRRPEPSVMFAVPLAATPMHEHDTWRLDHVRLRAVGSGMNESISASNRFRMEDALMDPGERLTFSVPAASFQAARARHAEIQVTLYLTSFRQVVRQPVASLDGESIDGFSVCRRSSDPTYRAIHCVSTRPVGACMIIDDPSRAGPRSATKNSAIYQCGHKYEPWPLPLWRDPYYWVVVPDKSWNVANIADAQEPLNSVQVDQRILSNYLPSAHFTRTLSFKIAAATEEPLAGVNQSVDGVGAAARFVAPTGMVADSHGNLFVVDQTDSVIRKVTPGGDVSTFAGRSGVTLRMDGTGADARFNRPRTIAIDAADNLYVAELGAGSLRKITPTGVVTTLADGAPVGPAHLHNPWLVTATGGAIYVFDDNQDQQPVLLKITPQGEVIKLAGPDSNR